MDLHFIVVLDSPYVDICRSKYFKRMQNLPLLKIVLFIMVKLEELKNLLVQDMSVFSVLC